MRYSFFRWIVTGAGFAMGPHRANPFTGQVYDADIIFDDSMVRFFRTEAERFLLPESVMNGKFRDPALSAFLKRNPQWKRPLRDWEQVLLGEDQQSQMRDFVYRRLRERGRHACDYAQGMKHQMALAQTVLAGQPPEVIERFLYDVIKEVVTHEVGHTLGLRHNFKASSIYSLEEIQRRRTTGEATCGSVMDYNPALLFATNATDGHFVTPTIGPYDFWAIEYGYRPFEPGKQPQKKESGEEATKEGGKAEPGVETKVTAAPKVVATPGGASIDLSQIPKEVLAQMPPEIRKMIESDAASAMMSSSGGTPTTPDKPSATPTFSAPPAGEAAMLQAIASRAAEPELAYATDEDTFFLAPDPKTNRFDMGGDPLDWARTRVELVNKRMENVLEWAVKEKEPWYHLRATFLTLLFEKAFVLDYVGRYIGGQYFNRSHRGDPDAEPPFVLVEPERQREALEFIETHLFNDDFFAFQPQVLNHLAPSRWWHEGSMVSLTMDFPIHEYVGLFQWWNLFDRLFPNTIRRIHDAELKTNAEDKFTAAEYIRRIQRACWNDVTDLKRLKSRDWSDGKPFISSVRRSLQREYLGLMEPMVRQRPGTVISADLHAMLCYSLERLAADLGEVIETGKADFASQAHLATCKSRIERMLSADLKEFEPRPAGGMVFMRDTGSPD